MQSFPRPNRPLLTRHDFAHHENANSVFQLKQELEDLTEELSVLQSSLFGKWPLISIHLGSDYGAKALEESSAYS